MSQLIKVETRQNILHIRMNRPDKKNAVNLEMYQAMTAALKDGESRSEVQVILFSGEGGCFSSGNDLADFLDNPPVDESSPVLAFLHAISTAKKPLVSGVEGVAIGIGTTMLLHSDLAYAGESTRFALPFVNLGVCPEAGSSYILPQMVGHRKAAEILLLGDPFTAETAREFGIVNQVVSDGEAVKVAWEKAEQLAAKPPQSLRTSKALMKRHQARAVQDAMEAEGEKFIPLVAGAEAKEALTAFLEKRKPDFSKFS